MCDFFPEKTEFYTAQWVLPVTGKPIEQGFVAVFDGKIFAVGPLSELQEGRRPSPPKPDSLLTPGLVNAHVHLEQSYPEVTPRFAGKPFSDWLLAVVRKNREQGSSKEKYSRALAGCRELLATGTTCVNDVASGNESLWALDESGLRGVVSLEFFHPAHELVQVEAIVSAYERLNAEFATHPRLKVGLSPHSPYNVSPVAWKAVIDACSPPLVHAHVAESEDEIAHVQGQISGISDLHQKVLGRVFPPQTTAASPVALLERFGLLTEKTILAHAVHTDAKDRKRLADFGVSIAHCPRSNLFLHEKTLCYADWATSGVVMALGTDGRISTENMDLREEARCAMRLHGWSAADALRVMTLEGARALKLEGVTGSLEPGKQADFVLWRTNCRGRSPEDALLSPETQAVEIWTDGQSRWRNPVC